MKHGFVSKFAGERCPICGENRLAALLNYPVCMRCRSRYDITEDLLKQLQAHHLQITQEFIDWNQTPHPTLTGLIDDNVQWQASHLSITERWSVVIKSPDKQLSSDERTALVRLIGQYLNSITPAWLERKRTKQTKIRRYAFFAAAGLTIVTAAWFLNKRAERLKRELNEAEEIEKKEK